MPRQPWIANRCRQFGLTVVEVDGWQTRGKDDFTPKGVVCHHTGGAATGEMPSLRVLINGRADLPGPLCQVGLARSGAVYVVAAGRANHAGKGSWRGLTGNRSVLGIEAENNGTQPWPSEQVRAYWRLAAALVTGPGVGGDVRNVCGHKEWAPGRKPDPHMLSMPTFREEVTRIIRNGPEEDLMGVASWGFILHPGEEATWPLPPDKYLRDITIASSGTKAAGVWTDDKGSHQGKPATMDLTGTHDRIIGGEPPTTAKGVYYRNDGPGLLTVTFRIRDKE